MSLNVAIPDTFSGPLDLLLHLIRRDEMDIHDIPIARLTSAYLEEMRKLTIVDVDEAAEFLDLASRLLEIKGRMLLPPEEAREDGEADDEALDPRADLVEALLEYRRFKEAARLLGDLAEEQERRYPRVAPRMEFSFVEEESGGADAMDLFAAFQAMLIRIVPADESTEITYTEVPTSVRIRQIEEVLAGLGKTRFSLLLSEKPTRREMVGFFIAILELVRQGRVVARQSANFSDIILEKAEPRRAGVVRAILGYATSARTGACQTMSRRVGSTSRSLCALFAAAPSRVGSAHGEKSARSVYAGRLSSFPPPAPRGRGCVGVLRSLAGAPRFFC